MAPTTVVERYGALSAVGIAKETTFGTAVTPTTFVPFTDATLESDPGLFYPQVVMGIRDVNVFALYGQRKNAGDVSGPFYPTNGIQLFTASIGSDGGATGTPLNGYGVIATAGTAVSNTTTLSAGSSVGATTISVASATGISAGVFIQIDVNNTTTPTTAEVRKVAAGYTTGTSIPLDSALNFSHLSAATVKVIPNTASSVTTNGTNTLNSTSMTVASGTGILNGMTVTGNGVQTGTTVVSGGGTTSLTLSQPVTQANTTVAMTFTGYTPQFTHTILPANTLPSLTIEKNIGGYQSLQFAGSKIGKYTLKLAASDTEAQFTSSVISKSVAVLDNPTPISGIINESPFVFAEATLTFMGNTSAQVMSANLDIENGLKPTYTFNGSRDLQFLTPLTRKITGQLEVVFTSLDDSDWGYYSKMQNQAQASLTLTMTHPATATGGAESLSIVLPQINLAKYADGLKLEDVVMTTLDFEASYALGAAVPQSIYATVTNAAWLPY